MSDLATDHTLIIDIGKTHVKLHILDQGYESVYSRQMSNKPDTGGDYPCANVAGIWDWFVVTIKEVTKSYRVTRLTITTHGATAALIDRSNQSGDGLVLPVLDYEYEATYNDTPSYDEVRPVFTQTFSPSLPAGLNLGRQLFWLKQQYPEQFAKASDILMYPQYWAWRFTGTLTSEVTSLGCHTDLWSIESEDLSSLADALACRDKFPELQPAWFNCGEVLPELAEELGLAAGCEFFSGLHDSNASFLRYRLSQNNEPFTVVSTGTWTIIMASQVPLENLDPTKDMLANVDALGTPIACARFMGGREFESICDQAGSWLGEQFGLEHIQAVIDKKVYALPDFSNGSGPFGGQSSGFVGPVDKVSGIALATLYCALMIDYQLDKLAARGKVFIEGAFLKNPLLCAVLNQLRQDQEVCLSLDSTGTVLGAAYLTNWDGEKGGIETSPVDVVDLSGLQEYKQEWLNEVSK